MKILFHNNAYYDIENIFMSHKLFERLNNMSVDEIINEDFESIDDVIEEIINRPCSIEEANNYFFQDGELTMEEMNILMENKLKEIWHYRKKTVVWTLKDSGIFRSKNISKSTVN